MSVKITVSYETDDEITAIASRLNDLGAKLRVYPPKGQYKRAYITIGYKRKPKVDKSKQERYNDPAEAIEIMDIESKYPIS